MPIGYDTIASSYDRRYELHDYAGVWATVTRIVEPARRGRVLEVGCGTGRWLARLASLGCRVAGIDPSGEMLRRASRAVEGDLRQGVAERLPWPGESFDAVLYVNSLHHCASPETALRESARVLRPGGTLLSIGLDPHEGRDRWYVYDFFPETLPADLERFPPAARRTTWCRTAGLADVVIGEAEHLQASASLTEALRQGVLERSFTSQLTALSDGAYAAGMQRLRDADAADPSLRLVTDVVLYATSARKPAAVLPARGR